MWGGVGRCVCVVVVVVVGVGGGGMCVGRGVGGLGGWGGGGPGSECGRANGGALAPGRATATCPVPAGMQDLEHSGLQAL